MNPRRLPGDKPLHGFPDQTKGEDGNFQTLDALRLFDMKVVSRYVFLRTFYV